MKTTDSKIKVAVLAGGIGTERNISIQSGNCIAKALKDAGINVIVADITPTNLDILEDTTIDVFFIALHGQFGEDGQLQKILEDKSLLYTGSGPAASKLAFDKLASKKHFIDAGLTTPRAIQFNGQTDPEELQQQLTQVGDKFVVKPLREGSSAGISIITETDKIVTAAQKCLDQFGNCMIEEYITPREITVGILCGKPLPIIEIRPKSGFYDYHAKYIDDQTEYLFDTINDSALIEKIHTAAMDCFNVLGCRDFARVDFIMDNDKKPYALEVNTIPGFTTHSLLPKAAAKAGFPMSNLCEKIIEAALERQKAGNVGIVETPAKSKKTKTAIVNQGANS